MFGGDGPIEVLGLVCMCENSEEDWKASDEAIDKFLEKFRSGLPYHKYELPSDWHGYI